MRISARSPKKRQEVAMSEMVLPQNLSKSASSEASSSSGASRPANGKSGDSSFDAVSRSEQKRLEARDADESRAAKRAEKDQSSDPKVAESDPGKPPNEPSDAVNTGESKSPDAGNTDETSGQNLAAEKEPSFEHDGDELLISSPVTFADLQSLAGPVQPQGPTAAAGLEAKGTGALASGQGLPFVQNSLMSMAGISGNGKNGSVTLQTPGQSGSQTGMALAEALLAGVTGDGGKASDSPMLQNAIRFQGALESVSAPANAVNTPRMAPDAPILRGYATSIDLPVSHAEWGDKVAGKLTWLTARNMSVAEIHLTPPDMGPMEVKVQVHQEQASITVHSANPVVREQLELHSHRLRDMLSDQGFSLENFDVSDSGSDQTRDGDAETDERPGQGLMADAGQEAIGTDLPSLDLTWKGEVDIFA